MIYGPRRVGKTTLIQHYVQQYDRDALLVTGEDITVREYLESQSLVKLRAFIGQRRTLIIDEAQYVRQIGLNLKLLADHVEGLRIIATGSSSFDLAQQTGEPLTGRKYTLLLLPLAQLELQEVETAHQTRAQLELRLIYGSYPEVVLMESNEDRQLYIKELIASYLFKDILQLEGIRHADKLLRLLQLLAFQIGREVSVAELGTQLGMNKNTVERYLDLLEKAYILYSRRGFSRNLRKPPPGHPEAGVKRTAIVRSRSSIKGITSISSPVQNRPTTRPISEPAGRGPRCPHLYGSSGPVPSSALLPSACQRRSPLHPRSDSSDCLATLRRGRIPV